MTDNGVNTGNNKVSLQIPKCCLEYAKTSSRYVGAKSYKELQINLRIAYQKVFSKVIEKYYCK